MTKILSVENIELYYDHIYALKGVSIDVDEGETVALIGANGAGKSSILRAITGLRPVKSGQIFYQGQKLNGTSAAEIVRRGISMVPEGRRAFPLMSVKDNLLMGAFTRTDKAEIEQTLENVLTRFPRLRERYHQQASTMSGGEQQMMVIGRALMARPKLLLLDEPSLGIAPMLVRAIFEQIVAINKERGLTILLVEQNANLALKISSYGYVLETGQVLLQDTAAALRANPQVREAYLGD